MEQTAFRKKPLNNVNFILARSGSVSNIIHQAEIIVIQVDEIMAMSNKSQKRLFGKFLKSLGKKIMKECSHA